MNKISFLLFILFFLSQPAFAEDWDKLSPYLPNNGVIKGDIIKRVRQEEIETIGAKLQKAILSRKDLFAEYMKYAEKGKPIPYRSDLGLTEKEYERYVVTIHGFFEEKLKILCSLPKSYAT